MDTSSEYRNMCEKATEIQDLWKPKEGDFFGHYGEIWTDWMGNNKTESLTGLQQIWLPRQDQLQEILLEDESVGVVHTEFNDFCFGRHRYPEITCSYQAYSLQLINYAEGGFEVLWLAFFMKKRYNKIWGMGKWRTIPHDG